MAVDVAWPISPPTRELTDVSDGPEISPDAVAFVTEPAVVDPIKPPTWVPVASTLLVAKVLLPAEPIAPADWPINPPTLFTPDTKPVVCDTLFTTVLVSENPISPPAYLTVPVTVPVEVVLVTVPFHSRPINPPTSLPPTTEAELALVPTAAPVSTANALLAPTAYPTIPPTLLFPETLLSAGSTA